MKRVGGFAILVVWTGLGCVSMPKNWHPEEKGTTVIHPTASTDTKPKPLKPVIPEQVTVENCHQKAQALLEEMKSESVSQ